MVANRGGNILLFLTDRQIVRKGNGWRSRVALGHALFSGFSIDAGVRGVWQDFQATGLVRNFNWLTFVALNFQNDGQL